MQEILGERVCLREIEEKDHVPLWNMIYGEDSPEWKKWDAPYYLLDRIDFAQFEQQIREQVKREEPVPSRVAITTTGGELIGIVSYYWEHKLSFWLEVGIVIYKPEFWNGGYGTEALKLWIDHLFTSLPLVRIGLATWSGNHRMIRSAEKLGMKMEARIRKARLHQDTYYDAVRMGVLREEWPIVARTDEEEVHECK